MNGSLRSTVVGAQNAAQATGSLSITGTEQSVTTDPCGGAAGAVSNTSTPDTSGGTIGSASNAPTPGIITSCPKTIFDHGTVTITVNGHADTANYGSGSTSTTVASGLASAINADAAAVVTASSSGSTLFLTAKQSGPGGDYSWSASAVSTDTTGNFGPGASFNPSPSSGALAGGANAVTGTTVFDTGAVSVSVGGFTGQAVPYGSTTGIDVRFTNDSCTACSGTAGGGDRNLFVNSITVGTTTILPTDPSVSYVGAPCNATSNGVGSLFCNGDLDVTTSATGQPITVAAYGSPDAGVYPTMQLLVNGTLVGQWTVTGTAQNYTVSVPAGDTAAGQLASALAATLNVSSSPVTASVSGSSIVINYKSVGTGGNVAAKINSAPSNPNLFPGGSFSGSTSLAGGQDSFPSGLPHPYVTLYRYDTLGNMICVEQHGDVAGTGCSSSPSSDATSPWRVRRFTYDSLSRLLSSKNPESGTISYQYDPDSNVSSKTDARGITITYGYDQVHRLTQKSYSDGSSPVSFFYDSYPGVSSDNSIGRIVHQSNNVNAAEFFSYDPLGRVKSQNNWTPNSPSITANPITAQYDDAGNLTSLTYPDGRTVSTGYNAAGRMTSVKVGTFSYYTVPQGADPTTWGYWPTGAMNRGTYGNGVIETTGYNIRLQVSSIADAKGSTTFFSKSYGYYDSAGRDNGDILSIADTLSATRNQTYSYDSLNRVISGSQADNSFNVTYHYDPWGNMTESGTSNFTQPFDNLNRMQAPPSCSPNLAQFCYDAAGDLLMDNQGHVYTYDVEGRIKTVDGAVASYTYGPDGSRIRKDANGAATEYIYFAGNVIAEKNVTTGAWTDYIFGYGGKRIAKDTSLNGTAAQYYQDDHLGTTRVMTDAAGTVISNCTFNAFGEQIACSPDNTSNHYRYGGKEHDGESQLDDFGARYYSSSMGRWITPDWSPTPEAVPYGDLSNPQDLNRYSYVRNSPESLTDPDGHCTIDREKHGFWWCVGHALGVTQSQKEKVTEARNFLQNNQIFLHGKRVDPSKLNDQQALQAYHDFLAEATKAGLQMGGINPLPFMQLGVFPDPGKMASGHAWTQHQGEFPGWSQSDFKKAIEETVQNPDEVKQLSNGRTAYWNDREKMVVIHDPSSPDHGTAFRPTNGKTYFDNSLK